MFAPVGPTRDEMVFWGTREPQPRAASFRRRTTDSARAAVLNPSAGAARRASSHLAGYKNPSPDWNVRNADVTTLDKLVVTVLSWSPAGGQGASR